MEATGRNDGSAVGPYWSYRRRHEEIESSSYTISSSSRSGTIVSSAAYTSGASRLSSGGFSTEMDAEFTQPIKKPRELTEETLKEMKMKHIESLIQDFFRGPSENHSILGGGSGGGMSALERWFSELGIRWVLQHDVGASVWAVEHPTTDETRNWIRALTQIMETIHLTGSFFADHGHGFVGIPRISEKQEVDSGKQAATSVDPLRFALFFQKAMAKMLVFVDVMFASVPLSSCLYVNRALSNALSGIRLQFHSSLSAEVQKLEKEMVSLLSAKQGKAFDTIWSFMEERRTHIVKSMEDYLRAETPQGSSNIHQATCLVMKHIQFLFVLYKCDPLFVSQAASLGKYVPQTGLEEAQPFVSMIAEMVSCLEEKLIAKSQSFLDKGLGLLFLLNNSNFIPEQLQDSLSCVGVDLAAIISSITRKVENYIESYLRVSWEPMVARLLNHRPLRLVRKYTPLSKFKSEFQETCTTQKLWKVPDPGLRTRLRKAVTEKVIAAYTKHIEDSKVTNPKFTRQEMEELLQDLFEG